MTGFNSKRDAAADKDALFQKFEVEQPVQEPVDIASIIACREMLDAQPVPAQEPLAWMCSAFDGEPCEQTNHDECGNPIPLYTTPPQREWVGLTDADIADCMEMSIQKTCRAVEAKLKERNS